MTLITDFELFETLLRQHAHYPEHACQSFQESPPSSPHDERAHEMAKEHEKKDDDDEDEKVCPHTSLMMEGCHKICEACGALMNKEISFEKDWRFYGNGDTRYQNDPNRCHGRKAEDITIFKDVDRLGFSEKIIMRANAIYEEVTQKKIYRGNSRRGIIFACIFHAYKLHGTPQSCESLMKVFTIERKVALKGLKYVHLNAAKHTLMRQHCICPEDLIVEIMDKFSGTPEQKHEILTMYRHVQNRSSLLNRSRPQSVASGMVRYYILYKGKDVPMHVFRGMVGLSELTIHRVAKEIQRVLEEKQSEKKKIV
jgi:transcription initiation factor TFIIIB Brf1 subunit/transcription initiation factor TFIIB